MQQSELDILLARYIKNVLSGEELERFCSLINHADDSTLTLLLQERWASNISGKRLANDEATELLSTIRSRTSYKAKRSTTPLYYKLMGVAATVTLLILCSLSSYLYIDRSKLAVLAQSEIAIKTQKGQRTQVRLPDGSTVDLNSESQLIYQQSYGLNDRRVELTGEGYFSVVNNPLKEFVVGGDDVNIRVLGTTFNARTYDAINEVEITLMEGSIELTTNTDPVQSVRLKPNEKAVFDKRSGKLTIEPTEGDLETAWISNEMVFRSIPLKDVFARIERRYGVNIHINGENPLLDEFTGMFDVEDLDDVISVLEKHYSFTYRIIEYDVFVDFERRVGNKSPLQ